jgi:hypothetical protein
VVYGDIVASSITDNFRHEAIVGLCLAEMDICMFHVDFEDDVFSKVRVH